MAATSRPVGPNTLVVPVSDSPVASSNIGTPGSHPAFAAAGAARADVGESEERSVLTGSTTLVVCGAVGKKIYN